MLRSWATPYKQKMGFSLIISNRTLRQVQLESILRYEILLKGKIYET